MRPPALSHLAKSFAPILKLHGQFCNNSGAHLLKQPPTHTSYFTQISPQFSKKFQKIFKKKFQKKILLRLGSINHHFRLHNVATANPEHLHARLGVPMLTIGCSLHSNARHATKKTHQENTNRPNVRTYPKNSTKREKTREDNTLFLVSNTCEHSLY